MFSLFSAIASNFLYLFLKVSYTQSFPPPLPPKEEAACFEKMRQGDMEARNRLIEHNLRLVAHIVKKYYTTNKNQDDLISIGTIGLIKAIDTFDSKNGTRFATYASKCLQNEILMYFRSQKKLSCEVSLSEPIDVDKDGNPLTYIDIISTDDTIAEELDSKIKSARAKKIINTVLDKRERQIIILRYGLAGEPAITQREVASRLGISRSYVSRIEKSALSKINSYISPGIF
ncbi:MAG: RNA polymerase sporulation sigma factor SigK [Clostridia bacterium]|nr:RNA polymerase sporulation sigma factor SigK [Clostridia bacterium]